MWFEIPPEHRDKPEAIELLRLDEEFGELCAFDIANPRLWEKDLPAFEVLCRRKREIAQALKQAVAAYDLATGEPKPAELPREILTAIDRQFREGERAAVVAKLSKTSGYLNRGSKCDSSVLGCILTLAQGDMKRLHHYADEALVDWRDVIMAASGLRVTDITRPRP
jgi:hypothetical protein